VLEQAEEAKVLLESMVPRPGEPQRFSVDTLLRGYDGMAPICASLQPVRGVTQ
jgi:hypothetical protein